jgi:methylmalonyl-CoA carboxyltransferase 12S subunit
MVTKKSGTKSKSEDAAGRLLARIEDLEARVAHLEAARGAEGQALAARATEARPAAAAEIAPALPVSGTVEAATEEISEEVLAVIAASVAAFLGERAHIRQVRLVASDAWAQQGRVSVMASHRWAVHR